MAMHGRFLMLPQAFSAAVPRQTILIWETELFPKTSSQAQCKTWIHWVCAHEMHFPTKREQSMREVSDMGRTLISIDQAC